MTEYRSPSENLIKSNDEYLWANIVATGLLVIRLSRSFAAKPAANWVMKRKVFTWRWLTADICFGLILGLISTA